MTKLHGKTLFNSALWLCVTVAHLSAPLNAAGDELPNTDDIVRTMKSTENSANDIYVDDLKERLVREYQALFANANESRLAELRHNRNVGVSLQAAWQSVRSTAPAEEEAAPEKLDPSSIGRFIGFVDGRLPVAPPPFWIEMLATSIHGPASKRRLFTYNEKASVEPRSNDKAGYRALEIGRDGIASHHARELSQENGTVFLDTGAVAIVIPRELLEQLAEVDELVLDVKVEAVPVSPTRVILGFYDSLGSAYPLYCIDRTTHKTIWKATVWCEWPPIAGATGLFMHRMQPVVNDGIVYVFGISHYSAYIEAFSIKTGEAEFRFSTSY